MGWYLAPCSVGQEGSEYNLLGGPSGQAPRMVGLRGMAGVIQNQQAVRIISALNESHDLVDCVASWALVGYFPRFNVEAIEIGKNRLESANLILNTQVVAFPAHQQHFDVYILAAVALGPCSLNSEVELSCEASLRDMITRKCCVV